MRFGMMMIGGLVVLGGCGASAADSCTAYFDAATACSVESCNGDTACEDLVSTSFPDTYCDSYNELKGADAKAAIDLLDCGADAYNAADCSTADGVAAAATEFAACGT